MEFELGIFILLLLSINHSVIPWVLLVKRFSWISTTLGYPKKEKRENKNFCVPLLEETYQAPYSIMDGQP